MNFLLSRWCGLPVVLSVVDIELSKLSIELLLAAWKLDIPDELCFVYVLIQSFSSQIPSQFSPY